MSHSHEDRVADRQPGMCAAYGCPLHGTMSNGTTGGDDWWCYLHHGRDGAVVQQITTILNRYRWLADVLTTALEVHPIRGEASNLDRMDWICRTLSANKREDLQWRGRPENVRMWSNRLKPVLEQLVLSELERMPVQASITAPTGTRSGVSELIPDFD